MVQDVWTTEMKNQMDVSTKGNSQTFAEGFICEFVHQRLIFSKGMEGWEILSMQTLG